MTKRILSKSNLCTLYFSLIHPYLTYGNLLWGSAYQTHLKKLTVLQKRAIRAITRSKYNDHSSPLFKQLQILKCEDIHRYELAKFVFLVANNMLPSPLLSIYNKNSQIHTYRTHQQQNMHFGKIRCDLVFRSLLYKGPLIWSNLPVEIKESNTVKSFGSRLKKIIISDY